MVPATKGSPPAQRGASSLSCQVPAPPGRGLCLCPRLPHGSHSSLSAQSLSPGPRATSPLPCTCWGPQHARVPAGASGKSRTGPSPVGHFPAEHCSYTYPGRTPGGQPQRTGSWTPTQPSGAGRAVSSRAAAPGAGPVSGRLSEGSPRLAPGAAPGPEPLPPGHVLWPLQGLSCREPHSLRSRQRMN